jgi:hypothetical protein
MMSSAATTEQRVEHLWPVCRYRWWWLRWKGLATLVVCPKMPYNVLGAGIQIHLCRRDVCVSQDPLHVAQRQAGILGHAKEQVIAAAAHNYDA